MMQQSLILTGKQKLEWRRNETRELESDEILIRTIAGAISIGAELPQYNESDVTDPQPHYPKETGYESYGEVIKAGAEVKNIKIGDHVLAFYGHKNVGIVKANKVVKVPDSVEYRYALLNTLSCDAGKGVLKLKPEWKDKVLITGAGTIGLLTIHFLKNYMKIKHIDVLEPDESRRELAHTLGASNTYSAREQVPSVFYDFGLECSASKDAFHTQLKSLKYQKEVCILSDGNKDLFYLNEDFYAKELKIVGSSDGWDYQQHSIWFFNESVKTPHLTKIFNYEIHSDQLIACFAELSNLKKRPIKVLVKYF
ncbi:zinc-dependent alcohol dehydrogenase [Rossellomorea sp. DUT-2]|uniref:zinc-dependent alcohol dehydrogenase n=1 Tax=Rossellomorea sp. DUT-2 TaxID=3412021 RepID=UPI003D185FBA